MQFGTALASHTNFPYYLAVLAIWGVLAVRNGTIDKTEEARLALMQAFVCSVAVFALAYVLDGWLVTWLKAALDFPRPPAVFGAHNIVVVGIPEYHHSFPSGHTSFAALVVASVWPLLKRSQRAIGVFFVVWVMVSRISLGDHFPADVLGGALISIALVALVRAVFETLSCRRSRTHTPT